MITGTSKRRYYSEQKASAMTFPFFNSVVIHFVILSFILTMPLNSGSFTADAIKGLLVNLGNEQEELKVASGQFFPQIAFRDPGQGKMEESAVRQNGAEIKTAPETEEAVSVIEEPVKVPEEGKKADDKSNNQVQTAELVSAYEIFPEKRVPEPPQMKNDQLKAITLEDIEGHGGKKDEPAKVVATEKPAPAPVVSGKGTEEVVSTPSSPQRSALSAKTASPVSHGTIRPVEKGPQPDESPTMSARTESPVSPVSTKAGDKGAQSEKKPLPGRQIGGRMVEKPGSIREASKSEAISKIAVMNSEKIGFGLPKIEEPALKDIKIEVVLEGQDAGTLSIYLLKKPYPLPEQKSRKNRQENASCPVERKVEGSETGSRQTLSVVKAEKGIYTFVIDNKGTEESRAAVAFHLYEGQKGKRTKEYKTVLIQPGSVAKIKFILPDALFWDDGDRFSGEIENSSSTTKFNYESGLVWREEKD